MSGPAFASSSKTSWLQPSRIDENLLEVQLYPRKGQGWIYATPTGNSPQPLPGRPLSFPGAGGPQIRVMAGIPGDYPKSKVAQGPYQGREIGGGYRKDIYGSTVFGSGYPGDGETRGTAGRGFPFVFLPIVWPMEMLDDYPPYYKSLNLAGNDEYGSIDDIGRPGGPLTQISFTATSLPSAPYNYTLAIISDRDTIRSLADFIWDNCLDNRSNIKLNNEIQLSQFSTFQPSDALQYYRASSVVLLLPGYNNSAAFDNEVPYEPPAPLPAFADPAMVKCVNETIGKEVLLPFSGTSSLSAPTHASLALLLVMSTWVSRLF